VVAPITSQAHGRDYFDRAIHVGDARSTMKPKAGQLRSPSVVTVEQAAWLWLGAAHSGSVRDRSGHIYKPATLREYSRVLCLRGLPKFGHVRLAELTRGGAGLR